ncbi:hypothetical protein [Thiogranum longum]|jgi:hypothetical protein
MWSATERLLLSIVVLCLLAGCDQAPETHPPVTTTLQLHTPCDIQRGCVASDETLRVRIHFGLPPRALQPFPLQLRIEEGQTPDEVSVAFSMKGMDMGQNRYRLDHHAGGDWRGNVTLPICTSGRSDWLADVELVFDDRRFQLQVPFVLGK